MARFRFICLTQTLTARSALPVSSFGIHRPAQIKSGFRRNSDALAACNVAAFNDENHGRGRDVGEMVFQGRLHPRLLGVGLIMLTSMPGLEVEVDQLCAVYDAKTGRIHHVHRVITLKGGPHPGRKEIESRALEYAKREGNTTLDLKTVHLSPDQLHPGATHKINPKTGLLVSKPIKINQKAARALR